MFKYVPCHRHSALETTVAEARVEAPNVLIAHQIEINAEEAHEAAEHAASVAKVCIVILMTIGPLLTMVSLCTDNGFEVYRRTNYSC